MNIDTLSSRVRHDHIKAFPRGNSDELDQLND